MIYRSKILSNLVDKSIILVSANRHFRYHHVLSKNCNKMLIAMNIYHHKVYDNSSTIHIYRYTWIAPRNNQISSWIWSFWTLFTWSNCILSRYQRTHLSNNKCIRWWYVTIIIFANCNMVSYFLRHFSHFTIVDIISTTNWIQWSQSCTYYSDIFWR